LKLSNALQQVKHGLTFFETIIENHLNVPKICKALVIFLKMLISYKKIKSLALIKRKALNREKI
jgi:hypothetical protein